jgi:hypothetical protein
MGSHVADKRAVRYHYTRRPRGDGESQIQGIVCRMVDGHADLQSDVMEVHIRCRCRRDLGSQQSKAFSRLAGRQQFSAYLKPEDVGRLTQPEVRDEQVWLDPKQRLSEMAVRLLEHPLEGNRRVDNERQVRPPRLSLSASPFFPRAIAPGARRLPVNRGRPCGGGIRPGARLPADG